MKKKLIATTLGAVALAGAIAVKTVITTRADDKVACQTVGTFGDYLTSEACQFDPVLDKKSGVTYVKVYKHMPDNTWAYSGRISNTDTTNFVAQ